MINFHTILCCLSAWTKKMKIENMIEKILNSQLLRESLQISKTSKIKYYLLGQGEYNINYWFIHPETKDEMVLRVTTGSQMHIENQISYEYKSLQLLEKSGRTPLPIYIDDSKSIIPYGFLVMNYLPGKSLDYNSDMSIAAEILADIHNLNIPCNNHLIKPENPLDAILDECKNMFNFYSNSDLGSNEVKKLIHYLLDSVEHIVKSNIYESKRCLVNTELNSGNFLINGSGCNNYLVDWEKPIYSFLEQDLGHFLAPTTTFWKTDSILKKSEIDYFLEEYCKYSKIINDPVKLWDTTKSYFTITCLRGITWCSMAWIEYQNPERLIKNDFTFKKIESYLSLEFLEMIKNNYIEAKV